ncbi:MAG: lipid-binding SYLF domain-containing protein [Acetobacteraceae bacterium]
MAFAGCATVSDATDAHNREDRAADVINQMNSQPATAALLRNARAVLIVQDYAKAAFIIGEQGGGAVLLAQHDGHWSDPAFYDVGGVSIGLQAGAEAGPVAYVLMTSRAVQEFESRDSKTTLGADAGLTVVKYSSDTNIVSSFPTADVVVWTGTAGLFGGVALDSSHVIADQELDKAYHQGPSPVSQTPNGAVRKRLANEPQVALSTGLTRP